MAHNFGVLIVGLLCVVATIAQQPNCTRLNIRDAVRGNSSNTLMPMAGSNLPYCRNSSSQCCTAEYLMRRRMEISNNIVASLRNELSNNDNIAALMDLQDVLERYIRDEFLSEFINALPGLGRVPDSAPRRQFVNAFVGQLKMNFRINATTSQFNLTLYFNELTMNLNEVLVGAINTFFPTLNLNQTQRACVGMEFRNAINHTGIKMLVNDIEQLRRVSSSLYRILRWYRFTFIERLANFRPLERCVARFISLNCAACSQNIPKLCQPTCTALIRGCLSPFQMGMSPQFDILWNVTRQIVNRGSMILADITTGERSVLNVDIGSTQQFLAFGTVVFQRCGITVGGSGRRRRQNNQNNNMMFRPPTAVMGNASRLMGSFRFGNNGPRFCLVNPNANCWNGMRMVDRDNTDFTGDTIRDQARNPVEAFNVSALIEQARALGTPVSDFLMSSEYSDVAPRQVDVPEGEPFNGSGSASLIKAAPVLILLLFAVLVALF